MRMTKFFRSKSCSLPRIIAAPTSNSGLFGRALESITGHETREEDTPTDMEEEEEEEVEDEEEGEEEEYLSLRRRRSRGGNKNINGSVSSGYNCSVTTPDAEAEETEQLQQPQWWRRRQNMNPKDPPSPPPPSHHQFPPLLAILVAALRKSLLVTCSVYRDDVSSHVDIGCPTDVRHVSHVTFDPFDGFLGLPIELQCDLPRKVPSASASVFGVSTQSMQCSYDHRGNSVPTILLMMQNRLYSEGGLQAEGIFRINAENSQEENVRNQLNKGVVPHGIDVHCLAGLIKAWFRELPTGVLDSLTPEQVMHCNTEEDCTQLVNSLPLTEAALLDWAINLMADIVLHEHYNKMNARNVAMVFAPNMTQMADPLTALIHAVQVMNFLKTLIMKKLREREESASRICSLSSAAHSKNLCNEMQPSGLGLAMQYEQDRDSHCNKGSDIDNLFDGGTLESKAGEKWSFGITSNGREVRESVSSRISAMMCKSQCLESSQRDGLGGEEVDVMGLGGILDQLNLRKGVRRLCRHPVFQLSKAGNKKKADSGFVNGRGGGETWA